MAITSTKKPKKKIFTQQQTGNQHISSMQQGASNILVAVRVRPESTFEKENADPKRRSPIVKVIDDHMLVFDSSSHFDDPYQRRAMGAPRRGKDLRFAPDRVFDERATQMQVYQHTTKFLLDGVLNGYNATIFAYGATGINNFI